MSNRMKEYREEAPDSVESGSASKNRTADPLQQKANGESRAGDSPQEKQQQKSTGRKGGRRQFFGRKGYFVSNSRYFTISVYTIITVLICTILIRGIFMWESTCKAFTALLHWSFPYLMGIFIACLLYPLVAFMEEHVFSHLPEKYRGIGKGLSILLTYLLFLGVIILVIGVIIPQVISSVWDMVSMVPLWYQNTIQFLNELNAKTPDIDFEFITRKLQEFGTEFLSGGNLQTQIQGILVTVVSTSVSVVTVLLDILIALIVSIYLLVDRNRIGAATTKVLGAFVSERTVKKIARISGECYRIFSSFVSGKMLDSLIIGILCFIAMTVLNLPYALIISVVVGVTNMIPYFGPFIGAVPGAFILLMVSPVRMLIYLVLILVLQQFDGLYLGPKILGDSTGLRPAWIIFAVSAGGAVCGVIGMFIGVPVVAVIGHLFGIFVDSRIERREAQREFPQEEKIIVTEEPGKATVVIEKNE